MMQKTAKNAAYILCICFGFVLIVFGTYMHIEANPDVSYTTYRLEDQYIGDIAGCEDCLIMQVTPVILDNWKFVEKGDSHLLYFAEDRKLIDADNGAIISVRWLTSPLTHRSRIDGVEVITNLTYNYLDNTTKC